MEIGMTGENCTVGEEKIVRGLQLRVQAQALLQQAAEEDGLRPFSVTHRHEHGSTTAILWAARFPTEEQAATVLEAEYEPERGECLDIEAYFTLDEISGVSSRLQDTFCERVAD
jgi:hypothetical protein